MQNIDWSEIGQATLDTLAMLGGSMALTVVLGLPLGVILFLTGRGQMLENRLANAALSVMVNVLRSVPFVILLSRRIKVQPDKIRWIAIWILFIHFVDLYWCVMPQVNPQWAIPDWPNVTAFLGVGGLSVGVAVTIFRGKYAVPVNDPFLAESLDYHVITAGTNYTYDDASHDVDDAEAADAGDRRGLAADHRRVGGDLVGLGPLHLVGEVGGTEGAGTRVEDPVEAELDIARLHLAPLAAGEDGGVVEEDPLVEMVGIGQAIGADLPALGQRGLQRQRRIEVDQQVEDLVDDMARRGIV